MGRKALLAVVCWLTLSETLGEALKTVNNSIADNDSEASAPRLYHKVPAGVYASGTPYGSYSFHAPAVISAPYVAGSQVKETVLQDSGFLRNLKDSYGKFVQTPQTAAYKSAFPQQYVQLQELPVHLSQPLVAAAPSFQYKQSAPHFFFGSQQYRIPSLHQAATPTPLTRFTGMSQPLVYANNIRSFAPSSGFHVHSFSSSPQDLKNAQTFQGNAAKFQRLQEKPQLHVVSESNKDAKQQATHNENGQIEAAPAQTSVTTYVNGKKTVITLETKPPVPLLDLSLLEPLTFDNPLVPQVQHFLPRINSATYHTLPQFVNEQKKRQKEIIVTNSYDSEPEQAPKKKLNKPRPQIVPARPTVTVEESPNASPEISYEINQPGYKETYNEQVVSYNKKTNMKPVTYTYNEKTHKEPVTYSFSHSSKEPLQVKHVEYESDPEDPKQLIYKLQPEEQDEEEDDRPPPLQSGDSGESSAESEEEGPASQPQRVEHHSHHGDTPRHSQHQSGHHNDSPKHQTEYQGHHVDSPRHSHHHHGDSPRHSQHHSHHDDSPRHSHHQGVHQGQHEQVPKPYPHHSKHHSHHEESPRNLQRHGKLPSHSHHHGDYHGKPPAPPSQSHHGEHHGHHEGPPRQAQHHGEHRGYHDSPRQSHHLRPEHREEPHHRPNQEVHHEVVHVNPNLYSQPLTETVPNGEIHPLITEYEEDIRLLQPHNAPIKVDPSQHVQLGPSTPHQSAPPSPAPQKLAHHHHVQKNTASPHSRPHSNSAPHIIEKSKHIIIKEDEETPEELHSHAEQLMAQMLDQEENNEEDFEKAYKESAFGFPAYEESTESGKDVYDPESYGAPRFHNEYNIESNPFQQYQEEGDEFPKSTRANYKDIRDKTKEDYFSEFSVNKPQSFDDRYKQKEDYLKTYESNKPEKLFAHEDDRKRNKKSEKFIAAPTYLFHTSSKPKQKQYFAPYKTAPKAYGFDYPKQAPRDNGAYGSRLYHRYKTHFVEPQYQYGFEPIAAPILLDSELAAMASNNSPETEKPGIRKKVYKENWYIKKTSTTAGKPS